MNTEDPFIRKDMFKGIYPFNGRVPLHNFITLPIIRSKCCSFRSIFLNRRHIYLFPFDIVTSLRRDSVRFLQHKTDSLLHLLKNLPSLNLHILRCFSSIACWVGAGCRDRTDIHDFYENIAFSYSMCDVWAANVPNLSICPSRAWSSGAPEAGTRGQVVGRVA